MIRKYLFSVLIIFFGISRNDVYSQYEIKCKYLLNPELNIGYVDSCAKFWLNSFDESFGGFYTNIDRQGNLISSWGTNKNLLTQSRIAYGYSKAFMLTGNNDYLIKAKQAIDFMVISSWDKQNGGWISQSDKYGNPIGQKDNKTAFDQHYALLGLLAYYEATRDTSVYAWFKKGFENNELNLWDYDENLFGYYDNCSYDWSIKNGKSFNATVDAVTTHLLDIYLITGEYIYKEKLLKIADNIINRLSSSMDYYKIGFVESYGNDWTWNDYPDNYNTRTIMGHVLKAGWVLGRIYQLIPDPLYLDNAEKLVSDVLEKGYDNKYGGPFKDYDRVTGQMYFYGQDSAKAWWQVEQSIMSGLELYNLTKNDQYLKMADESLNFFMKYFVDHKYGEIYADLFSNGSTIPAWGTAKGNGGKSAYHSVETGYYAYIYGNAFCNKNSFNLYYKVDPAEFDREFNLSPLALKERLVIKNVTLDSVLYNNYFADTRKLYIKEGVGGTFKVEFQISVPLSVEATNIIENKFVLNQNYPNPFNPTTSIKYSVPKNNFSTISNISIKVYDVLGREIQTLVDKTQSPGNYEILFDASNLTAGVYFYKYQSSTYSITKKMIFLK